MRLFTLFMLFSAQVAAADSPLKLSRPHLPPARDGRTHPVDRIVDAYWAKRGAGRPAAVGGAAFLRRVSLDLVGLLPEPAALDAFAGRGDRAKAVRRLLSQKRRYAEHWLTFWNDLLRNDYTGPGYIDGGRKPITQWLYKSLYDNKPYDRFVRELVAPAKGAEGFVRGIKWRGRVNASQRPEMQFAQNVPQVFLGVNLKCASCHNSFINAWRLKDAYAMASVIADEPLEVHRCDSPTGETAAAAFLFPELGKLDPSRPKRERLKRLAGLLTHKDNGRFARTIVNRLWQRLTGRGVVHPVDVMGEEPWSRDLLDYLAWHLIENRYDLKKTLELIVTSRAYQSQSASWKEGTEFVFRGPLTRRMTAEQFIDAVWRITGTAPPRPVVFVGERGGEPVRASLMPSDPLMRSLGRPERSQVVTTRPAEFSTLQALDLTNGPEAAALLARGAERLRKDHPEWDGGRLIGYLFKAGLGREPTPAERRVCARVLKEQGLSDLLWAVFMLPEFQLIR